MRPIIIVVEGLTEKRFVDDCLAPYLFQQFGIHDVSARELGVPGKKGGNVSFSRVKLDVTLLLKQRGDAIVTMLVDYYGMRTDFPDYTQCHQHNLTDTRLDCLEKSLEKAIDSQRFLAYFQKYEFEALLFCKGKSLTNYFTVTICEEIQLLRQTVLTPEDINTNFPPSYRLNELFIQHEKIGYRKTLHGPLMALELGINTILADCPRFAKWVQTIGQKASSMA